MPVTTSARFILWYLYGAVLICLAYVAAGRGLSVWSVVLLLSFGFVSWGLIEYGLHRFVFHYEARSRIGQRLLYHAHIAHHENPEGNTRHFASLLLSMPVAVVYWLIAWAATGSWAVASYLFIGMASGYLTYQWLHFQCHHRKSRVRVLRYLRKYHLLHHYRTPELRFGVTSPLFDLVFGTFRPVVERSLSRSREV